MKIKQLVISLLLPNWCPTFKVIKSSDNSPCVPHVKTVFLCFKRDVEYAVKKVVDHDSDALMLAQVAKFIREAEQLRFNSHFADNCQENAAPATFFMVFLSTAFGVLPKLRTGCRQLLS